MLTSSRSVPRIRLYLLLCLSVISLARSWSVYYIAAAEDYCNTTCPANCNCTTMNRLQNQIAELPHSHLLLIILPGEHIIDRGSGEYHFEGFVDLVITGDKPCREEPSNCTILCKLSRWCHFLFSDTNSTGLHNTVHHHSCNISLSNILVKGPTGKDKHTKTLNRTFWNFESVENVTMQNVVFEGDSTIEIKQPLGVTNITGCQFKGLPPGLHPKKSYYRPSILISINRTSQYINTFTTEISNCLFEAQSPYQSNIKTLLETTQPIQIMEASNKIGVVRSMSPILIKSCTFLKSTALYACLKGPSSIFIAIEKSIIDGSINWNDSILTTNPFLSINSSGIIIVIENAPHLLINGSSNDSNSCPPTVSITGNHFTRLCSSKATALKIIQRGQPSCSMLVRMAKNTLINNWSKCYGSIIYAKLASGPFETKSIRQLTTLVNITENLLIQNKAVYFECLTDTKCKRYYIQGTFLPFSEPCNQVPNWQWQGAVHLEGYSNDTTASFKGNNITSNILTGITLHNSNLQLLGCNYISKNYGVAGGGILILNSSQLYFTNNSQLLLSGNMAKSSGGGIFVNNFYYLFENITLPCFFQFADDKGNILERAQLKSMNVTVNFTENDALMSARSIFNLNLQNCSLNTYFTDAPNITEVVLKIFNLSHMLDQNEVASYPVDICTCKKGKRFKCVGEKALSYSLYPGQNLIVKLIVVGDLQIPLSSTIEVYFNNTYIDKDMKEIDSMSLGFTRVLKKRCNEFNIPVYSKLSYGHQTIDLRVPLFENTPDSDCNSVWLNKPINITIMDICPTGFQLNEDLAQCQCSFILKQFGITCHLKTNSFQVAKNQWIGTSNNQLLVSNYCHPTYCKSNTEEVKLTDNHCINGRQGILCGQCPEGESVILGSYGCQKCSNIYILIVIPFLLLGPLFILFLCTFNLTITAGTVNGLLLYINLFNICYDSFPSNFYKSSPNIILAFRTVSYFPLCFYDGMAEFGKTVILLGFPIYLITLVVLICVCSNFINMHRINMLIGPRICPVLNTVILLSYSAMFDHVIRALRGTLLCDLTCRKVWLYDGSLTYFNSTKHIILGTIAISILVCFLIPVAFIALFGNKLKRFIRWRWYMNFFDTFRGAFKFQFSFWIGIRLLARVLLLVLKVNTDDDAEVILLATACVAFVLLFVQFLIKPFKKLKVENFSCSERINKYIFTEKFKESAITYLDNLYLLNIGLLFLALLYDRVNSYLAVCISISAAVAQFIVIFIFHLVEYSPFRKCVIICFSRVRSRCRRQAQEEMRQPVEDQGSMRSVVTLDLPNELRAANCRDSDSDTSSATDDEDLTEPANLEGIHLLSQK